MSNHAHLVIETPLPNLGAGMQRVHGVYARSFNKRHERSGHHFQGRYGSVRIGDDSHLWTVLRYVALNPVEAGLCERADQWRWSSYGGVLRDAAPAWVDATRLLGLLGAFGGDPRQRYADLAET